MLDNIKLITKILTTSILTAILIIFSVHFLVNYSTRKNRDNISLSTNYKLTEVAFNNNKLGKRFLSKKTQLTNKAFNQNTIHLEK